MTDEFPIEKGIPIPPKNTGHRYNWRKMKVGDSFFLEGRTVTSLNPTVNNAERRTGFTFTMRTVEENEKVGVRVWRKT